MVILFLIFPIFIIKGLPKWMWRKIVYAPVFKSIIRVLTKPIVALVSFNVLFSLYHMPVIFDYSKSSQFAHTSKILILLFFALIIFASTPVFNAYSSEGSWIQAMSLCVPNDVLDGLAVSISGPEMFSPLSVLEDQQLGGIIMKIMQEIVYIVMLARIFFSWFTRESLTVDPLPTTEIQE